MLKINISEEGRVTIIEFVGMIDGASKFLGKGELYTAIVGQVKKGRRRLLLDFSEVEHFSLRRFGSFLGAYCRVLDAGGSIKILHAGIHYGKNYKRDDAYVSERGKPGLLPRRFVYPKKDQGVPQSTAYVIDCMTTTILDIQPFDNKEEAVKSFDEGRKRK